MARYLVTYKTKNGSISGAGIFNTKTEARKFIQKTKKNKSFRKLGYHDLRIRKND